MAFFDRVKAFMASPAGTAAQAGVTVTPPGRVARLLSLAWKIGLGGLFTTEVASAINPDYSLLARLGIGSDPADLREEARRMGIAEIDELRRDVSLKGLEAQMPQDRSLAEDLLGTQEEIVGRHARMAEALPLAVSQGMTPIELYESLGIDTGQQLMQVLREDERQSLRAMRGQPLPSPEQILGIK